MAVEDLRWWTGSEWVSVKDFNDHKLPTESVDGTVVLDSPAASTFTIETAGAERLRVRADGAIGVGYAGQADINFAVYLPFSAASLTETGILAAPQFDDKPSQDCFSVQSQPLFKAGVKAARMSHFYATDGRGGNAEMLSTTQIGLRIANLQKGEHNVGVQVSVNEAAGKDNFAIDCQGNAPSRFFGEIHCNTLTSYAAADGDAEIDFIGQVMTVSTAGTERLRVDAAGHVAVNCIPRSNTQFEVKSDAASPFVTIFDGSSSTDYDGRSGWRLYNGSLLCDFAIDPVSLTYGFSGGNSGGSQIIPGGMTHADIEIKPKNWVKLNEPLMVPSGTAAAPSYAFIGDPDTGTFSPAADTFAISTGGTERLRVGASGVQLSAGTLAISAPPSAGIGIYNAASLTGTGSLVGSLNYVTVGAGVTAASIRCVDAIYNNAGTINGDVFQFIARASSTNTGTITGKAVAFRAENLSPSIGSGQYAFWSSVADGVDRWNLYVDGTAPNYFHGQVQCHTGNADEPALSCFGDTDTGVFFGGADMVAISTAGTEALRVGPFGTVGIGTIAAPATARSALLYVRGTPNRPDSSAGIFSLDATVSQTQAFGVYLDLTVGDGTTLGAFIASDVKGVSAAGSGVVDRFIGYRVRNIAAGATDITAFESNINLDGSNTRYAFHAAGSAPSKFGGWIEGIDGSSATPAYTFAGDLDTGAFRPTTDTFAISTAGTERLRVGATGQITAAAGYTPAAEQDLATRKYVDDQVGGTTTTADVVLTNPQDNTFLRFAPQGQYLTQEDANQAFVQGLTERKIVLPISQVDYDALPVKDPDTLYLIVT